MFEGAMSPMHWLVVLAIVMVLFGGKKLPELGKGLGQAIRGFKEAMREDAAGGESPKAPSTTDIATRSDNNANRR